MADTTTAPAVDNAETQVNTQTVAPTTETPKVEEQKEHMIPKSRFDEVLGKLKTYEAKLAEEEKSKAFEAGKQEEYYKAQLEKLQGELSARDKAILEVNKNQIIKELDIPETLKKFVVGNNEDEIKQSALELKKELEASGISKKKEDLKIGLDKTKDIKTDKVGDITLEDVKNLDFYKKNKDAIKELLKQSLSK